MDETLAPVTLNSIQDARRVIARSAVRTPLVKLNVLDAPAEIYLKLEYASFREATSTSQSSQ